MPTSSFSPLLLIVLLHRLSGLPPSVHADLPPPRGFLVNCGAAKETTVNGVKWLTDDGFITAGNSSGLSTPGVAAALATLRYFPDAAARKSCYTFPVTKGSKFLVRTTYYYGGFDGGAVPPVFDQIVGGTKWSVVNTSADYRRGLASYYEIVVRATGKTLGVCLARNSATGSSSPFISALEVEFLEDSMYNSTAFSDHALATVARYSFGGGKAIMSYPDDPFNRYWEPFSDGGGNPVVESHSEVDSSDFWNFAPAAAFKNGLTTSRGKELVIRWPPAELPAGGYYIALYFQDNRTPSPYSWRVFDVAVNGRVFYQNLNVSAAGVMVYATDWLLAGKTEITMTPHSDSPVGPVINAGEILRVVSLHGRTVTRDVIAMEEMARSLDGVPADWNGDPCLPRENSWTGITCSEGKHVRVVTLNLTNCGLSGTLPASISSLTALTTLWLGGNNISGSIPDLSSLNQLVSLHLEDNQLTGPIPPSLGRMKKIKEIFLQNNHLQGKLPPGLTGRSGVNIQISPGNEISQP